MIKLVKGLISEEDGLGTVEIVIIIAVLVGIALIFRNTIFTFAKELIGKMFPQDLPNDNSGWKPVN